jgi:hypothetical protein
MDVIVTPAERGTAWQLTDLLGPPMGIIKESAPHRFTIHPQAHALETMDRINHGPHASLDAVVTSRETLKRFLIASWFLVIE